MKGPPKKRFELIFSKGVRLHGPTLRFVVFEGTGLVGFAVSKKLGEKPPRNRQKRRAREALMACGGPLPNRDLVVVVGEKAASKAYTELVTEMTNLRSRADASA